MTVLRLERLTRRFGGLVAVSDVSFSVAEGELVGIIGPNGAGKSTLFGLIAGGLAPSAGRIHFAGRDVTGWAPDAAARAGIGRTYQIMRVFRSMSVLDNVMLGSYLRERSTAAARAAALGVMERLGLAPLAYHPATALTVAWKKRLELARALATRPRLLLLDEVMSGLTPAETSDAIALVRALNADGLSILLVEHVMEVIMGLSQRVIVLDHGVRIAEGPPQQIARDEAVIAAYLGREQLGA